MPPPHTHTHLRCTPDRRVTDLNADPCHGLLKMKGPNSDSYMSCPPLIKREDGSHSLKHGLEYHSGANGVDGGRVRVCDLFTMQG